MGTEPQILATEPDLWVVEKPAGWFTVTGRDSKDPAPVLSEWLAHETGSKVWVVHRLDAGTSGLLVFARSEESHKALNNVFQNHQAKKIYECLAQGRASKPMMRLNAPIEGKRSLTQVEVLKQFPKAFHARVRIETGRQHQIRIHLSGQGHPLLGDVRYGGNDAGLDLSFSVNRPALHAKSLRLPDGRQWECPLPADFHGWLERLAQGEFQS
jgi:23S rRNA pseudouridine1911/1915/1917 synthase